MTKKTLGSAYYDDREYLFEERPDFSDRYKKVKGDDKKVSEKQLKDDYLSGGV
jgi:hypothetical protein